MTTPWPGAFVKRFTEDMDRLFDDWTTGRGWLAPMFRREPIGKRFEELFRGVFSPDIELTEKDGKIIVRADLPGIGKEDVSVEVTDGALRITGERRRNEEEKHEGYYRSERSYGSFERTIPLPEGADTAAAAASFKDGVLEVSIPTPRRENNARRVSID
jgi:HSP20 family protein